MCGCSNLGVMYDLGKGVKRDAKEAVRLYKRACDGENMEACVNLGAAYYNGQGVTTDDKQAVRLYRKACDGGLMAGCHELGKMYESGEGVAKDEQEAGRLYKRACGGGYKRACVGRFLSWAGAFRGRPQRSGALDKTPKTPECYTEPDDPDRGWCDTSAILPGEALSFYARYWGANPAAFRFDVPGLPNGITCNDLEGADPIDTWDSNELRLRIHHMTCKLKGGELAGLFAHIEHVRGTSHVWLFGKSYLMRDAELLATLVQGPKGGDGSNLFKP
jgi:TPR repeat protein